jgi:hypothetical protein
MKNNDPVQTETERPVQADTIWSRPLSHVPSWLRNKYFISICAFLAIMLFLDKNDLLTQVERRKELKDLQQSRAYYTGQISLERKELEGLKTNPSTVEQYAREKFLMKRDNEELFLVPEKPDTDKN